MARRTAAYYAGTGPTSSLVHTRYSNSHSAVQSCFRLHSPGGRPTCRVPNVVGASRGLPPVSLLFRRREPAVDASEAGTVYKSTVRKPAHVLPSCVRRKLVRVAPPCGAAYISGYFISLDRGPRYFTSRGGGTEVPDAVEINAGGRRPAVSCGCGTDMVVVFLVTSSRHRSAGNCDQPPRI